MKINAASAHVLRAARKYITHRIPHTAKYIPRPALYCLDDAPAIAAVTPLEASAAGAKLAARPNVGWTAIPYEIQNPPLVEEA